MPFVRNRNIIIPLTVFTVSMLAVSLHPNLEAKWAIAFFVYAMFVFWVVWLRAPAVAQAVQPVASHAKFYRLLLVLAAVFFLATRLYLFVRYGAAPLGYDTGFYLRAFDSVFTEIQATRAVRALLWVPFTSMGIPPIAILHGLYVFSQFLILGGVYMVMRTFASGEKLPFVALAVFLFVMSIPQFVAFWWMFYQMEMAVGFLLISIALFHRRSLLVILTAGFGAMVHPATFLPFLIAAAIFLTLRLLRTVFGLKKPYREVVFMFVVALAAATGALFFGGGFIAGYLEYSVGQYGWFYTNFPLEQQLEFTGLYMGRTLFVLSNLYVLPFAVLGVFFFVMHRFVFAKPIYRVRHQLLFILMIVLLFITHFPFLYQHRFLVVLDLVLIIFATYPMVLFVQYFLRERHGRLVVTLLLSGFFLSNGYFVLNQTPQVYPGELQEIRDIAVIADKDAYAMATESIYTPWVLAFSDRQTIDPGYLQVNRWNYEMWLEFWDGDNNDRRHELLHLYNRPIYLFTGSSIPAGKPYMKFIRTDPAFTKVSDHVWYYDPR